MRTVRTDDEIRSIHGEAVAIAKKGGSVSLHFTKRDIPVGTFYARCKQLGLDYNFKAMKPGAKKTPRKSQGSFAKFIPANTTENQIQVEYNGMTIKCSNSEMLKEVIDAVRGGL